MFRQNVGGFDRIFRIMVGLLLIVLGFLVLSGIWGLVVGIFGFVPLLTGLVGWCPLYLPFKLTTRKS